MTPRRGSAGPAEGLALRRRILLLAFGLAGAAVLSRAFQLQAVEADRWTAAALEQQRERVPLPARRGTIYDRDGVALALSHETYRISVAPHEVRDAAALRDRLRSALGLTASEARRATDRARRWVVLPGRFSVEERQALGEHRGVYAERRLERFYPQGRVGRELIGVVTTDGRALGGIEQQLDGMLRGEPGYSVLRRDARGDAVPALSLPVVPATDGADVHLTIDFDLQEIADAALRDAVQTTGSHGGDLVILDPRTGELLAAVSRRRDGVSLAAITEPYEPGSTLKPFMVAALLAERRARLGEVVSGEGGRWKDPTGRTITDSHVIEEMTLREALIESSNIGMVKFAARLPPGTQYQYLRDFGFGTPTGISYPSEAGGVLRRPAQWSAYSAASLAMGYEISVTPLQLSAAYGALANEGVLMEPFMVREVRGPTGESLHRRSPRALRRVVPASIAREVTRVLVDVVESGTATRASLASFEVAGKTGTARRTGSDGRYEAGAYTSTFVSYFPADDPQIVILVKLDRPTGAYYGGITAAPVTRETLQGILATRSSALDGRTLLAARLPGDTPLARLTGASEAETSRRAPASARSASPAPPSSAGRVDRDSDPVVRWDAAVSALAPARRPVPHVFDLTGAAATEAPRAEGVVDSAPSGSGGVGSAVVEPLIVPDLAGLPFREAARRAHAAGVHVRLQGRGTVRATRPASGGSLAPGDTLLLIGGVE